jgi:hypothetical protein
MFKQNAEIMFLLTVFYFQLLNLPVDLIHTAVQFPETVILYANGKRKTGVIVSYGIEKETDLSVGFVQIRYCIDCQKNNEKNADQRNTDRFIYKYKIAKD